MIKLTNGLTGAQIPYRTINFSDGTRNVVLDVAPIDLIGEITFRIDGIDAGESTLFEIIMLHDAILAASPLYMGIQLYFNYLPHARADRRFELGASFPLNCFIKTLLDQCKGVKRLCTVDAHNPDAISEIVKSYPNTEYINLQQGLFLAHKIPRGSVILFPDKGAKDRYHRQYTSNSQCYALKHRNPKTGHIESVTIDPEDASLLAGANVVIVDDICDGGGTFIPVAKEAKGFGALTVSLLVTHGIFSKGLGVFEGIIDNIACLNHIGHFVDQVDLERFNKLK